MTKAQKLGWRLFVIHDDIKELKEYHQAVEAWLQREIRKSAKRFQREKKRVPRNELFELEEFYSEKEDMMQNEFTQRLRYAVVAAGYSFFEASLNSLARSLRKDGRTQLELEDIRGEGIFRAKTFLEKACALSFPENRRPWQEILKLNLVRNTIVHGEGWVTRMSNPGKVRGVANNSSGATLRGNRIVLAKNYVEQALVNVEKCLEQVHKAI